MTNKKICVGVFLGPHGVRGLLKLGSFTDDPDSVFDYAPLTDEKGTRTFVLTPKGVGKDHTIVALEGCTTREQSEMMKGVKLYVDRESLPESEEGEYYFADLIGLVAQDGAGKKIGDVTDVHDYGAGAFLEIQPLTGKSFMLPFKDAFVPTVDTQGGFVEIVIPDGWLKEEKKDE